MAKNDYRTIYSSKFCTLSTSSYIFDVYLLTRQCKVDFLRLRYIVVMHNKRICNDVCKFLNCTVFLQDFRGAIAENLAEQLLFRLLCIGIVTD